MLKKPFAQYTGLDFVEALILVYALITLGRSLLDNIVDPLIGLVLGTINFSNLALVIGPLAIHYGAFLNTLLYAVLLILILLGLVRLVKRLCNPILPH